MYYFFFRRKLSLTVNARLCLQHLTVTVAAKEDNYDNFMYRLEDDMACT